MLLQYMSKLKISKYKLMATTSFTLSDLFILGYFLFSKTYYRVVYDYFLRYNNLSTMDVGEQVFTHLSAIIESSTSLVISLIFITNLITYILFLLERKWSIYYVLSFFWIKLILITLILFIELKASFFYLSYLLLPILEFSALIQIRLKNGDNKT